MGVEDVIDKIVTIKLDDLRYILDEGIDLEWQSQNFPLINELRKLVGLETYSPERCEKIQEYWRNL